MESDTVIVRTQSGTEIAPKAVQYDWETLPRFASGKQFNYLVNGVTGWCPK
jgi:hypothetical protein